MVKLRPFIGPVQQKVLNFGIDTFIANFKLAGSDGKPNGENLPEDVVLLLDTWQQAARKEHKPLPTPLEYNGKTLAIRPHGKNIWSWMLFNEDVSLTLSHGSMSGSVFCQARFSSHLLWSKPVEDCLTALQSMLFDFTKQLPYAQASEIHLCADIQGWYDFLDGALNWQDGFVSRVTVMRARPDELPTEREQEGGLSPKEIHTLNEAGEDRDVAVCPIPTTTHRRIATLDFGTHGSQIMGQIYNKSEEIKKSGKSFFEKLWTLNGWDGLSTVVRHEIRIRRDFLRDHNLDEAFEVLAHIRILWEYATQKWLRYVDLDATEDTNKSRLPTNLTWQLIQSAGNYDEPDMLLDAERERDARISVMLEQKPLQVLANVVSLSVPKDEALHEPMTSIETVRETLQDEPLEVVREMAREELAKLDREQQATLLYWLNPSLEPFQLVREELVKRERRMAKKKMCTAGLNGYFTSLVAICYQEHQEVDHFPSLPTSVRMAVDELQKYSKKKSQVHAEEVLKKQQSYGFITAHMLDEMRKKYGIDLSDADWQELDTTLDDLGQVQKNVRVNKMLHEPAA